MFQFWIKSSGKPLLKKLSSLKKSLTSQNSQIHYQQCYSLIDSYLALKNDFWVFASIRFSFFYKCISTAEETQSFLLIVNTTSLKIKLTSRQIPPEGTSFGRLQKETCWYSPLWREPGGTLKTRINMVILKNTIIFNEFKFLLV